MLRTEHQEEGYKRQHYLPVAYLKFFSCNPSKGRNARIYRFDGRKSSFVSVKNQCKGKFIYSESERLLTEQYFGFRESNYANIVRKIIKGKSLTDDEYYFFILMMFDINMRNIAYKYRGFSNRFRAYMQMKQLFIENVIAQLPLVFQSNPTEVARDALKKNWKFKSIYGAHGDFFITSDHPSIWFDLGDLRPVLVVLPITPQIIGVAYDIREIDIISHITSLHDVSILNGYQCFQSYSTIFSRTKFTKQQQKAAKTMFMSRRPRGLIVPESCWPELFTCPFSNERRRLSFLKVNLEAKFTFPRLRAEKRES